MVFFSKKFYIGSIVDAVWRSFFEKIWIVTIYGMSTGNNYVIVSKEVMGKTKGEQKMGKLNMKDDLLNEILDK